MLVLTRKSQEVVVVGGLDAPEHMLKVTVLEINAGKVKLGFEVNAGVPVHRLEVWERIRAGIPKKNTGDSSATSQMISCIIKVAALLFSLPLKGVCHDAWYYPAHYSGSDAFGRLTDLGAQSQLGLRPERRHQFVGGGHIGVGALEGFLMKRLLFVLLLIVVAVGAVGFYLGWFHIGSETVDGKTNVTFSMDQNKIKTDENKVLEKVHGAGQKGTE